MTEPEDPIAAEKAAARRAAFAARKQAHAEGGPAAAEAAAAAFLDAVPVGAGEIVSGYRPIRTEIDPTPLMTALIARGATLAVPVIEGPGLPLSFRVWTPESRMIEGPFKAEIPADGATVEPTLLIAPLVAFDADFYRLGYGGGFYDRTLERLRARRPTRAIGLAYAAQEVPAAPREPTDQPLDGVATERGVRFRA
ncbi:MAG: 5-formyltetrahydrofolate cyclo-ligase [Pseudomonadota bacterium]